MNAREIIPGVSRPPSRADYEPIVKAMRPFLKDEELQLRASLLLMRDRALATKDRACQPSYELLSVVEREASDAAMNWRIPVDDLREIRRLCLNCVASASSFDTLYRQAAPEAA